MSITADTADRKALQRARARHMRDLFEPWSYRKLEAKTGLGRTVLQSRFTGETALSMPDIEVLAPIVRMTPAELFDELLKVECTPRDLNPEPTDYRSARGTRGSSRPRNRAGRTSPKGRAA